MVNTPAPGAYSSTFQNSYYLATHLACVLTGWYVHLFGSVL